MNKNFKVIFNHARGCLVVANECAKSFGKSKNTVTTTASIAAGLLSLSLINPVLASESVNNDKIVGAGELIQVSDNKELTGQTKVIGGIDLSGLTSSDIANTNISIKLSEKTTIDEIIGGSQARTQKEKDKEALLHVGSSTLEAENITADRIIGGSKNSNSDSVNLTTDHISSTLADVTVMKDFVGGNLLKATGQGGGGPATAEGKTQSIENNILSGNFNGRFVGVYPAHLTEQEFPFSGTTLVCSGYQDRPV